MRKSNRMKRILTLVCLFAITVGCKQTNTSEDKGVEQTSTSTATTTEEVKQPESEKVKQLMSELLIPMEVVNKDAKDITKKYGLEFGGNCYACDVANIIVDGEMINLMNACDVQTQISFKITKIEEKDKTIIVHTPVNEFVFERVDDYPMYQLTVKGKEVDKEHFRTAGFYTLKSKLETFEVHDCGDFEG